METQVTQTSQIGIHKDMLISEILLKHQDHATELAEIMIDFGIHCVGCGAASFETLEQGVLGHGFSENDLSKLIKDMNKVLSGENKSIVKQISDFKLTLTESAVKKVKESLKSMNKSPDAELRISILAGGCSGFMYDLDFTDSPTKEDLHFKQDGVNIAVERNSLEFLNGTEIDFLDTLNESGFKFNNPNTSKECGCGKSFK